MTSQIRGKGSALFFLGGDGVVSLWKSGPIWAAELEGLPYGTAILGP